MQFRFPARWALRICLGALAGALLLAILPRAAVAQTATAESWRVRGRIVDAHHQPVSRVEVTFEMPDSDWTSPSPIETDVYGEFQTTLAYVPVVPQGRGAIVVKASKEGYYPGWDLLGPSLEAAREPLEIVLQDEDRVGNLPFPESVLAELAGYFTQRENLQAASSECLQGAHELLEKKEPIKGSLRIHKALELEPESAGCRFLMGLASFRGGAWRKAERYLEEFLPEEGDDAAGRMAADASVVIAVMKVLADDWPGARKQLALAVDADPSSPLALRELGRFLMFQGELDRAEQCFQDAQQKGGTAEVHLLRAEIFLLRRNLAEARKQHLAYWDKVFPLRHSRRFPLPEGQPTPYARYIGRAIQTLSAFESYGRVESVATMPLEKTVEANPTLQGIELAGSQDELQPLLHQMAKTVEDVIARLPNTISDERLVERQLDAKGKVKDTREYRLQYLLIMRPQWATTFAVEHRMVPGRELENNAARATGLLTTINSIMAMTLLHPRHRQGTEFRLLGRQPVGGRPAAVIAFAQAPLVTRVQGRLTTHRGDMPYLLQGLAWVDVATGHILRLRSELLKPLKEANIRHYSTDVEYSETRVEGAPGTYWLPRRIAVRLESGSEIYDGQHSFSDYRLYTAQSTVKTDLGELQ